MEKRGGLRRYKGKYRSQEIGEVGSSRRVRI